MNDHTLILYYYGDGLSDEARAAVEVALENDASLRERYRALRRTLEGFSEAPAAAAPAHMAARWHRSIERAAAAERTESASTARHWHVPSFAWGALAAALVLGVAMGLYFVERTEPVPSVADREDRVDIDERSPMQAMQAPAPASFSRGLKAHFLQSRQDIMRLTANGDSERRMLIMDIVRQNRLFERAARERDAEDLARVLRAFEPVLLRLASEDTSAADAEAVRAKLAFELNVMLTKMEQRVSDYPDSI